MFNSIDVDTEQNRALATATRSIRKKLNSSKKYVAALSTLGTPNDRAAFVALCTLFEHACIQFPDHREAFVQQVLSQINTVPSKLRCAPLHWINLFVHRVLPNSALGIISALVLSPALTDNSVDNPDYDRFKAWIRSLPEDSPTLDGLSVSRQYEYCQRQEVYQGVFAPKTEHCGRDLVWFFDMDEVLSAPPFRNIEIFDASADTPYFGPWEWSPTALDGRDLDLRTLFRLCPSDRLKVVDLQGQIFCDTWETYRRDHTGYPLIDVEVGPSIHHLRLGGCLPLNDTLFLSIAQNLPNLKSLTVETGNGTYAFNEDFDLEGTLYDPRIWLVTTENAKSDEHFLTEKGIAALNSMRQLKNLIWDFEQSESPNTWHDRAEKALSTLAPHIKRQSSNSPVEWERWFKMYSGERSC